MVIDLLDNIDLYRGLGPRIAEALQWVRDHDLTTLDLGRHEIAGDSVFALVSEYNTRPQAEGRWEAHRNFLDLQCLGAGRELIGYAPLPTLSGGDYIAEKDISWHTGDGRFMLLRAWPFHAALARRWTHARDRRRHPVASTEGGAEDPGLTTSG